MAEVAEFSGTENTRREDENTGELSFVSVMVICICEVAERGGTPLSSATTSKVYNN